MQQEREWIPRTKLGKQVAASEIKSIDEIFDTGLVIKEPEIVDTLLPDLEESVIAIGKAGRPFKMVQRMTDSGRRNNFQVIVAVGNKDGYVGLGEGRAKEYGPSLRKAIKEAKLSLVRLPRGCGSWQCSCDGLHSVPFKVEGHMGSVKIILKPAPKGIGLAASKTSRTILSLAGYSDVWVKSFGHTSARINLAKATFDALTNLSRMKAADIHKHYKPKPTFAEEVEALRDTDSSEGTGKPAKNKPKPPEHKQPEPKKPEEKKAEEKKPEENKAVEKKAKPKQKKAETEAGKKPEEKDAGSS